MRQLGVRRGQIDAVRLLDLTVPSGSWCVVVGPNGAGKSSLLRAIGGTLARTGVLTIDGTDVASLKPRERAQLLAVVPQRPELPDAMSVFQYVLLGRTAHLTIRPRGGEGSPCRGGSYRPSRSRELP